MKLNETSVEWAKKHLEKEGDTDLFPKPFEIEAIISNWDMVKDYLLNLEVRAHKWGGMRRLLIPKGEYMFRVACQLDPLDTLVLTALIHEYGDLIEKNRVPVNEEVVFSYRFKPKSDGSLYDNNINWNTFWRTSLERAEEHPNGYVVMTDVVDYYNQIYHHTLENELLKAGVPKEVVKSILNLCKNFTQGVSRGIPVGPHATHLLAEVAFNPIDHSLLTRGYEYCRFVDDIHIFCNSWEKAEIAIYDLSDILDKQQRLVIQSHKTRIVPVSEFIEIAEQMMIDSPINETEKEILEVIRKHSHGDPYRTIRLSELKPADLKLLNQQNIESLLESYLNQPNPNFPRIRWFLRRLAQVGVPSAIPYIIKNINRFIPAIGDICTYFISAEKTYKGSWQDIGKSLISSLEFEIVKHSEYLQMTLINLFSKIIDLDHIDAILQKYNGASPIIRRKIIKVATKAGKYYWLRERKTEFSTSDPWLRRALILGASTFPEDERQYWLRHIKKSGCSFLEEVVIEWVKSGNTI